MNKRLTNEELKIKFPSFYNKDFDYQSVYYGDKPLYVMKKEFYKFFSNEQRILRNLSVSDNWILYSNHLEDKKEFYKYETFVGTGVKSGDDIINYRMSIGKFIISYIKGNNDEEWLVEDLKKMIYASNHIKGDFRGSPHYKLEDKSDIREIIEYLSKKREHEIYGLFIKDCITHMMNYLDKYTENML